MLFELGDYQIEVATEFGPRITSLSLEGGPEIFAELGPDTGLPHGDELFRFRGGHRLWAAPEVPDISYAPDDHPCQVEETDGVVTVSAPPDAAGLVKTMAVSAEDDCLRVSHRLTAHRDGDLSVAPWAISQLPLGGTAIVPVVASDTSPRANRYLVLWPYTSLEDSRVTVGEDVLELRAAAGPAIKFGVGPTPGRLGYFNDGFVFVKEVEPAGDRVVPDFGAVGQVYVGHGFCELESVGGMVDFGAEASATITERWKIVDCGDLDSAISITLGT